MRFAWGKWTLVAALAATAGVAGDVSAAPQDKGVVPGQLVVGFVADAGPHEIRDALSAVRARHRNFGRSSIGVVTLPPGLDEDDAAATLRAMPCVAFAETDALVAPDATVPDDTSWNAQWHLPKVNAPAAWDLARGNDVIVAILDTGVDSAHPDLAAKMLPGWNFYDGNADTADVYDHGTSVAGMAAASTNNALGIAGLAWESRILPIRICDPSGYASFSAIAEGLVWAADSGARVANISYSVTGSSSIASAATYFENAGGVVVVSAGNTGTVESAPDDPHVLTVGAMNSLDQMCTWSSRGTTLDLCAPGSSVYSTANGSRYAFVTGTSFSAPLVAGAAALVKSVAPELPAQHVMSILRRSALDTGASGWDAQTGAGRLDASAAVAMALAERSATAPIAAFASPAENTVLQGPVTIRVEAASPVGVQRVALRRDGVLVGEITSAPYHFSWNASSVPSGTHVLSATVTDAQGVTSTVSRNVQVDNPADTTAPSVAIMSPTNGSRMARGVTVTVSATDNVRVVRVDLYADGSLVSSSTNAPFTTSWNPKKVAAGAHRLHCVARDAAGNGAQSQTVTVMK